MRLPLLSTNEAARLYRMHPDTIRHWARQGRLTNHGTTARPRWNPRELEDAARESRERNRAHPPTWPFAA